MIKPILTNFKYLECKFDNSKWRSLRFMEFSKRTVLKAPGRLSPVLGRTAQCLADFIATGVDSREPIVP